MDKKYFIFLIVVAILAAAFAFQHFWRGAINQSGKLQVAASFYPLYFFAQQIGQDKTAVTNITPAGAEPHDYEPTARDMAIIENSKLIILNGNGFEAWGKRIEQNVNSTYTIVIKAGEGLAGESVLDPHIWIDPVLAQEMVDKILQGFSQVDSQNADFYRANAQFLKIRLDNLDKEYRNGLANCKSKDIITSHEAFGYLAKEYGLTQVPIAGLSPDAEPSPQQLANIVKFIKDNNIKYIFFESLVSPKLAQTIANETGIQTLVLDPLEGISKKDINKGEDYFSLMENNLINLKLALQCQN